MSLCEGWSVPKEVREDLYTNGEIVVMKKIDIFGENRFDTFSKVREASRGIIVKDGMILLSHETASDCWMIPGGGREEGETPEGCCVREIEEETGLIVRVLQQLLELNEYYEEYRYLSRYYICEVTGKGQPHLTETEMKRGVRPEWIPLEEAVGIFSKHASYAAESEEKRGISQREDAALKTYLEWKRTAGKRHGTVEVRETAKEDLDDVRRLWANGDVMRYVGFPDGLIKTDRQMKDWFKRIEAGRPLLDHYSVFEDGRYCGESFYEIDAEHESAALDIKLFDFARGRGIAAAGLSHAIKEAFKNGAKTVWVDPVKENAKAIALYEKLGFVQKDYPDHLSYKGEEWNSVYMELHKDGIKQVFCPDEKLWLTETEKGEEHDH